LRGYSAPKLIIKDEAGFVSDAMQAALDPMLAVSKGRLIEMSSPNGKRGHFYENWQYGVGVERIKIIGGECPRIGAEFLDPASLPARDRPNFLAKYRVTTGAVAVSRR